MNCELSDRRAIFPAHGGGQLVQFTFENGGGKFPVSKNLNGEFFNLNGEFSPFPVLMTTIGDTLTVGDFKF